MLGFAFIAIRFKISLTVDSRLSNPNVIDLYFLCKTNYKKIRYENEIIYYYIYAFKEK